MPLRLWKDDNRKKDLRTVVGYYCNEKITFMMRACDPTSKDTFENTFGFPSDRWMGGDVTNVLVACSDRKPLQVQAMEAFGDFCAHHVRPYFQWQAEIGGDFEPEDAEYKEARQIVAEQMTPKVWSKYFSQWQNKKSGVVADVIEGVAGMGLDAKSGEALEDHIFKNNWANFKATGSFRGK